MLMKSRLCATNYSRSLGFVLLCPARCSQDINVLFPSIDPSQQPVFRFASFSFKDFSAPFEPLLKSKRHESMSTEINIRPATYADLLPASKCLAAAFKNESLFGEYMHPYRDQFPDDMYLHFLHQLRISYVSGPDKHFLVSTTKDENCNEIITGIAQWTRARAKPHDSFYTRTAIKAMERYNYLESFVYPNRARDDSTTGIMGGMWPFMAHHWTGTRAEVWDLTLLGVHPAYAGKGIGRVLVRWGFDQAKKEGVGCSVVSSDGTEKFYESCGFHIVGTVRDHGSKEENPANKVRGGTILFWDNGVEPKGVKKYGEA